MQDPGKEGWQSEPPSPAACRTTHTFFSGARESSESTECEATEPGEGGSPNCEALSRPTYVILAGGSSSTSQGVREHHRVAETFGYVPYNPAYNPLAE